MKLLGLDFSIQRQREINVEVMDVSHVEKTLSYGEVFSHGLPMELFFKQVTRPYENIASVYKSVKALCDNVPQAKLIILNEKEEEVDDAALDALLRNPNPRQSQIDFIQEWVGFFALYGEGFIKTISSLGQMAGTSRLPAQLVNLDPSKIKEAVDYTVGALTGWRIGASTFRLEEVIHTKEFNPYNPFRGMSPLKPIDDEMEIDQASLTFNNAFFKNNATPGLVLSTPESLGEIQRKQLKQQLEARHTGEGGANAHKTLILEKGLTANNINSTHKEMEFIEQKRLMREEILGIWRAPKALFNITDDLNYATFMGQMRIFWIYALMPIMRKFEDSVNKYIVKPYRQDIYVAFDYANVPAFQEDLKERVATGEVLNRMGFTANEVNKKLKLGFEDKEWREKWWISFSQVPAETNEGGKEKPAEEPLEEEPEDKPEEDKPKAAKTVQHDERKLKFLKLFGNKQGAVERRMESKVTRYFMDLRASVLKTPDNELVNVNLGINLTEWNSKFNKLFTPLMLEAIKQGVEIGEEVLGRKKTLGDDAFELKINSLLQVRMDKLTVGLNNTLKNKLESTLRETLTEQINVGASTLQQATALKESVRDIFNMSISRALMIARTESAGAVNGGSMLFYSNQGIGKKEWITAHDEFVRESHRDCEAQGVIGMANSFQNGLMFPGDQTGDAGEVINCRCSLLPIVE